MQELQVSLKQYYEQQKRIRDEIDNLTKLKRSAEKKERDFETQDRAKKNIKQSSTSFYSLRGNQDTLAGNWYGLYSDQEFNKMKARVQFGAANDETARRILHIAPYVIDDNGESHIILENAMTGRKDEFLNGGFLLDKESAAPLRNSYPAGYLVVHKDIIGGEGKILVSRIDLSGKTRWTYNTTLKEWEDWICTKKSLIILGTDNKNLSSNQANLLLIINMETGKAAQYDYFNDKLRK
jgi:hypothetical protein